MNQTATIMTPQQHHLDAPVDVRLRLSALWIAMLLVFAYVDIFGFFRADVLRAALDGTVASTSFTVDQTFLGLTLVYVLPPILMVVLSLVLRTRANRITTVSVAALYAVTIVINCIGEQWTYYLAGSAVEVAILLVIVWSALRWQSPRA